MKRIALSILLFATCICTILSQNNAMYIYRNNGQINAFLKSDVDSIKYSHTGLDNLVHHEYMIQEVWTRDSVYKIPLSEIDSVSLVSSHSPIESQPLAIDLGLPSGTKWCTHNVGASYPEDYGGYYAWGETTEKSEYTKANYAFYDKSTGNYINIGSEISGSQYDVATVLMGAPWRMPTYEQQKELIEYCTWQWTQLNGVNGYMVTGPNENQIFLPAGGDYNDNIYGVGDYGLFWSSSLFPSVDKDGAYYTYFYSGSWRERDRIRYIGQSVRPVVNAPIPDDNHHHAIDLGLPSGTKWCTHNVGASSPEDYGGYYAWGETTEKSMYNETNYAFYDKATGSYIDIGTEISGTKYDVARVIMGAPWHMPTIEQQKELVKCCTWKWTQLNGVNGYMITGPNENQIFLPAAGYRCDDKLKYSESNGSYWSGSKHQGYNRHAYDLSFGYGSCYWYLEFPYYGESVRPVCP